jgi:tetratricopeptide (TPR) repeat protein
MKQDKAWQPKYFLALIRWFQGEMAPARQLLEACGDEPRFGPFYAARAQVCETTAERDLQRAIELDPGEWRYGEMLARDYLERGDTAAALAVTTRFTGKFPTNGTLSVLHAKALAAGGRYESVANLLDGLNLLPSEGSIEARALYRDALLMVAARRLQTNAFAASLRLIESARQWPEHLGAGKPYPEDSDERLEDWLSYQCYRGEKNQSLAGQALKHILDFKPDPHSTGSGAILRALALKESGRGDQAEQLLKNWQQAAPESELAKWSAEFVAGQAAPLPKNIQDGVCRVLAAWRSPN